MGDKEAREYIQLVFDGYETRKNEKRLYEVDRGATTAIINTYIGYVKKPEFGILVEKYKSEYIYNEARVENNATKEEQAGLGEMYDYINSFDFDKQNFNIFVSALNLHCKLYSKCPCTSFGGKLRQSTAYLLDTNIEVMSPDQARKYFNSLIQTSDKIFEPLKNGNIIEYINNCIVQTVKLIEVQPFEDGNKRTFRALLSLLLKKVNIPPIYIEIHERDAYKEALLEAMKNHNYDKIISFYYFKICDAIMNLDINNSTIVNDDNYSIQKKY